MWIFKWDSALQQSQWTFNPACQKGTAALCSPASLRHPGQATCPWAPWVLSFPHARVSSGGEYTLWGTVSTQLTLGCESPAFPRSIIYYPWGYCLPGENLQWEYSLLLKFLRIFWIPNKKLLSFLNYWTSHGHKTYPHFIDTCWLN